MKKIVISTLFISLIAGSLWHNRLDILLSIAPSLRAWQLPVGPNQPVLWTQGPTQANLSPSQRPPNIILILADDMGFNDVSLYNGGAADGSLMTPHIDAIAREGVLFANGYAANSVCAPSRASLMTGRYSTRFGFEFTPFMNIGTTIFQWMSDLDPPALPVFIDHAIQSQDHGLMDRGALGNLCSDLPHQPCVPVLGERLSSGPECLQVGAKFPAVL